MANIYSASKSTSPIAMDYHTNPSKGLSFRGIQNFKSEITTSGFPQKGFSSDFAAAVYGNGPYSLEHPNATSDILANNLDLLG